MTDALLRQLAAAQRPPLRPANAVAALLVHEDGRYIMQLRDPKTDIFYPGHWGCFGGAVEAGEDPAQALKRELREELEFDMTAAKRFTRFDFDLATLGAGNVYRVYYEVFVPRGAFERFVLHEGAGLEAVDGGALLSSRPVTPYDAFAVWIHMFHARFVS